MKKLLLLISCLVVFKAHAQEPDTLVLTLSSAERLLLEHNLSLLAEQLNIKKADAEKIQTNVWPNPTLTIDEINPYVSSYQKRHAEEQSALFGSKNFGKYRQVSIQVEQLIALAGKRKKRKAIAKVSAEKAAAHLAGFLLDLKTEFRKNIFDFHYHQTYLELLEKELNSLKDIVKAYQRQSKKGNVNKIKLIRLRTSELKLKDEITREKSIIDKLHSELIILLNLPDGTPLSFHSIFKSDYDYESALNYTLSDLQDRALKKRPDILLSHLDTELAEKQFLYEKALAVPDLTFSIGYDRGGGIYPDFAGIGIAMDLPFSNSNKGNIKKAKIKIQQQAYYHDQHLVKIKAEIHKKYKRVLHIIQFLEDITPEYLNDLDQTMEAYVEYFLSQTINIVEFMDFLESYIDNKQIIFQNQHDYLNAVEELKHSTGVDDIVK